VTPVTFPESGFSDHNEGNRPHPPEDTPPAAVPDASHADMAGFVPCTPSMHCPHVPRSDGHEVDIDPPTKAITGTCALPDDCGCTMSIRGNGGHRYCTDTQPCDDYENRVQTTTFGAADGPGDATADSPDAAGAGPSAAEAMTPAEAGRECDAQRVQTGRIEPPKADPPSAAPLAAARWVAGSSEVARWSRIERKLDVLLAVFRRAAWLTDEEIEAACGEDALYEVRRVMANMGAVARGQSFDGDEEEVASRDAVHAAARKFLCDRSPSEFRAERIGEPGEYPSTAWDRAICGVLISVVDQAGGRIGTMECMDACILAASPDRCKLFLRGDKLDRLEQAYAKAPPALRNGDANAGINFYRARDYLEWCNVIAVDHGGEDQPITRGTAVSHKRFWTHFLGGSSDALAAMALEVASKIWTKDPVRIQAEKDKEKARAAKRKADEKKAAAERRANERKFPDTPEEKHALALYRYGIALRKELSAALGRPGVWNRNHAADCLLLTLTMLAVDREGRRYVNIVPAAATPTDAQRVVVLAKIRDGKPFEIPDVAKRLNDALALEWAEPRYMDWNKRVVSVPLPPPAVWVIDCMEALCARWNIKHGLNRPAPPGEPAAAKRPRKRKEAPRE